MNTITVTDLLAAYRAGRLDVRTHLGEVMRTIRAADAHHIWISVLDDAQLEPYLARLEASDPAELPLYGVPFAIKDNIDLAGVPTTAACPDYAYTPDRSAFVVQQLIDAGAVPVGKTNLDQFATGLVGTRSPYGACRNAFDPDYLSGGSSSGSAVAAALGQVAFSLGTDTAGSGRVPAMFNNLVGVKPTRGLLSASGVVPACRTLDTVSIFALTGLDAERVLDVAAGFDREDAYARPDRVPELGHGAIPAEGFRFGVPRREQLAFFDDAENPTHFDTTIERLVELGGTPVEIDFAPFLEAARLLYEGPWVAERYAAIEEFIEKSADSLHPVTRQIIAGGATPRAAEAFKAQYRLAALRRQTEAVWDEVDLIVTPTAGRHYRIDEVEADPVQKNSDLGYYTNFMNLLDFAALAVPAGFRRDGLPFGVTLFAPAFTDRDLLALGDRLQRASVARLGATEQSLPDEAVTVGGEHVIPVAVCGAHLSGLPLNWQLTERRARLAEVTTTAPEYRFYALPGGPPERPGLVRVSQGGAAIDVEVWHVPASEFGSFVAGIPAPLGIGKLTLADGREVPGFIAEPIAIEGAVEGATDITELGSWRRHLDTSR
ncbi:MULTISPECIES: allophanate hydrolase [unclassified Guyparkeria]|uniref:allophanate hydrolase n=1 Tax=unclassified Guyparkeria TaxID=2626246 RepID=UPI0007337F95|nr:MULTISPECIES: allophanate hydrolase [unclassified Guyparkeria]KTG16200.1 allophanate hydrolase [Guyparkeria sp. XI15]OAE85051.1 allophanate hydrolase [Guyparkeria sp. WRN-7]